MGGLVTSQAPQADVHEMGPLGSIVLVPAGLVVGRVESRRVQFFLVGRLEPRGRREAVPFVPAGRVGLEGVDHGLEHIVQPVLRGPSEQLAGAGDVDLVVVLGHSRHERSDEGRFAPIDGVRHQRLGLLLEPGPGDGE
jgi:hypothetical protein